MIDQGPPKKPRVAAIPQLARVDWLHYALIGGRIACGLSLLMFIWYAWVAFGERRIVVSAASSDGAGPETFVCLEGQFRFPDEGGADPHDAGSGPPAPGWRSPGGPVASTSRKYVLFQGVEKDLGITSFWSAHLKMYKIPRRGGPFAGKVVNLDTHLDRSFQIVPVNGKPVAVAGAPTRMYGTSRFYRFDPPFLTEHVDAGPNLEVEVLTASAGFVLGVLKRDGLNDQVVPHPEKGFVFSGLPFSAVSLALTVRLAVSLICVALLGIAMMGTRRYACLDRALERPSQFCVFEATGGAEMVATIGILVVSFAGLMLLNPPGGIDDATTFYLRSAAALLLAGMTMSGSRVEFFYVANKADGMLYLLSRGLLSSGVISVMKLTEFNPKAAFEDVMTRNGERTSYYLETPTPNGGTLQVSDSYRDSVGPAEMLSEYQRFQKTEMTQSPIEIDRLLG